MNWSIFPTKTRRFKHCDSVSLTPDHAGTWTVVFYFRHSEVYPHTSFKVYSFCSDRVVNRILAVGGLSIHVMTILRSNPKQPYRRTIWIDKPVPTCMQEGCNNKVTVPTYLHETGYCVSHRPDTERIQNEW